MFKLYEKDGIVSSRIFTQIYLGGELLNFRIMPENIEIFLNDLDDILDVKEWERL